MVLAGEWLVQVGSDLVPVGVSFEFLKTSEPRVLIKVKEKFNFAEQ